jgi:hypothetical protein
MMCYKWSVYVINTPFITQYKIEIFINIFLLLFFIMTIRIETSGTKKYWVKHNPNGHEKAYDYNTKKFEGYWVPFLNNVCYWVDENHPCIEEPDLVLYPAE